MIVLVCIFLGVSLFVMCVLHNDSVACEWFEDRENRNKFYKKFEEHGIRVYVSKDRRTVFLSSRTLGVNERFITLFEAIKLYKKDDLQKSLKKRFK